MMQAWEKLDFEAGGLQSANLRLVRQLKRRNIAYFLWFLFPVGGHRIYLNDLPRALVYTGLTTAAVVLYLSLANWWALVPVVIAAAWALYDLVWIDRRVTQINKQIRLAEYLRPGNQPPAGFRGRYTDDTSTAMATDAEESRRNDSPVGTSTTTHGTKRIPSFAEQERMLRELTKPK